LKISIDFPDLNKDISNKNVVEVVRRPEKFKPETFTNITIQLPRNDTT